MSGVVIKLDGRFKKQLKLAFKHSQANVGILRDKPHKLPITATAARKRSWKKDSSADPFTAKVAGMYKTYAGGLARRTGKKSEDTIAGVSEKLRKRTGINFYTRPWKMRSNREIVRFTKIFVKGLLRPKEVPLRRMENLLQAVVRNPIVRGDYGRNSAVTAKIKGFNRFMIDTAQLISNIKAKVFRRV